MSEFYRQALEAFESGRLAQANTLALEILAKEPDHVGALSLIARCALFYGDLDTAADIFKKCCFLEPNQSVHYLNQSELFYRQAKYEQALSALKQALIYNPKLTVAYQNAANIYQKIGQPERALGCLKQALNLDPQNAQISFYLANQLYELGQLKPAVQYYLLTLGLNPENPRVHLVLGLVYQMMQNSTQALYHLQEVIALHYKQNESLLDAELNKAYDCLAHVYESLNLMSEARAALLCRQEREPHNLALKLHLKMMTKRVNLSQAEIVNYRSELFKLIDEYRNADFKIQGNEIHELIQPNPSLIYHGLSNREILTAFSGLYQHSFGALKEKVQNLWHKTIRTDQRKHIAFLVTQFHEGLFIKYMQDIILALPSEAYRISIVSEQRAWQEIIAPNLGAAEIHHLPLLGSFEENAVFLAKQGFDLLYFWEVGTDEMNYFLPYLDLAPIQCTSLGWPQTTGIANVDYFLSSALIEPESYQNNYSEKVHLFSGLPLHCKKPTFDSESFKIEDLGLSPLRNHYLCVQNPLKLHPDFDHALADILRNDPDGQMTLFKDKSLYVTERLRARLEGSMPDVYPRIHFLPRLKWNQYKNLIQQVDVLLDTPYYAGANTTLEACAAGTPVITLPGFAERGRYTLGCYRVMKIADTVAEHWSDYVAKANLIARDKSYQQDLRRRILGANHKLFERDVLREYVLFFEQILSA